MVRVLGLGFVGLGLCLAISGCGQIVTGALSYRWNECKGVIGQSKLEERERDGDKLYSHKIRYDYEVDGAFLSGTRIHVGDDSSGDSEKYVSRYPVGKEVTVYYAPGDPAECVLQRGIVGSSFVFVILGPILFLFGLALATSPGSATSPE